jgi:hypothetical protein
MLRTYFQKGSIQKNRDGMSKAENEVLIFSDNCQKELETEFK